MPWYFACVEMIKSLFEARIGGVDHEVRWDLVRTLLRRWLTGL